MSESMAVVVVGPKEDPSLDPTWVEVARNAMAELRALLDQWHTTTMRTGELLETVRVHQYYRAEGYASFAEFLRAHQWDATTCDQIKSRYLALCAPSRPVVARPRRELSQAAGSEPAVTGAAGEESGSDHHSVELADVGTPAGSEAPRGDVLGAECTTEDDPRNDDLPSAEPEDHAATDIATDGVLEHVADESATPIEAVITLPTCCPHPMDVAPSAMPSWSRDELAIAIDAATQHDDLAKVIRPTHCIRFLDALDRGGLVEFWESASRRDYILAAASVTGLARRLIARADRDELRALAESLTERFNDGTAYEDEYAE